MDNEAIDKSGPALRRIEPMRRGEGGSPDSAAWFRAALREIGQTQASMARLMQDKGDDRMLATIERHIRRMANGEARVSGEMRVVLALLKRV